jgi:hypothetical protein
MPYELDHLFVLAGHGAPEAESLIALGLSEGSPKVHKGQGTANRRFFFDNAMLELLYVTDGAEARSAPVAPTLLWERSCWRQTAASPFGLCLRATGDDTPLFPTFEYRPPYLPPGVAIPIARGTMAVEPMLFVAGGARPDALPPERREPLDHRLGVREISGIHIVSAGCEQPSDPLRAVQSLGIATFGNGAEHLLEVVFDRGERGQQADLRPDLPLRLRW